MLDEITKRNHVRYFDSSLDLIDHAHAFGLKSFRDVDDGLRSRASPNVVVVHGGVQGMHGQFRIAKPVAKFGDLRLIAIIDVLTGTEDFDCGKARFPNPLEP